MSMKPITLEQAKSLTTGTIVYAIEQTNADGTPMRLKVNGKVKTWKRDTSRVQVPYKRGLYEYGYITEQDIHLVSLTEE